jgi:hypothetical protein
MFVSFYCICDSLRKNNFSYIEIPFIQKRETKKVFEKFLNCGVWCHVFVEKIRTGTLDIVEFTVVYYKAAIVDRYENITHDELETLFTKLDNLVLA